LVSGVRIVRAQAEPQGGVLNASERAVLVAVPPDPAPGLAAALNASAVTLASADAPEARPCSALDHATAAVRIVIGVLSCHTLRCATGRRRDTILVRRKAREAPDIRRPNRAQERQKDVNMRGFKEFLMRGNLLDLAVAVVIGIAFGDVVKAFTAMLMDVLGMFGASPNFSGYAPYGVHVGAFITALISLVIVAAIIYFLIIKPVMMIKARTAKPIAEEVSAPTVEDLLVEIRDLLAKP
jgi:large conductance mechanosensitive channel